METIDMQKLTAPLIEKNQTKIMLMVLDGLGGLPAIEGPDAGKTELEAAYTPHMDALAAHSACGLHTPVAIGVTPGSGPGHLGLFGYDTITYQIGRGILECLGLGLEITANDIALRCNYATITGKGGLITDRRAGRIPTPDSRKLTEMLSREIKEVKGAGITFAPGMEHRFAIRIRFPKPLDHGADAINDTDPQHTGLAPLAPRGANKAAEAVAVVAEALAARIAEVLPSSGQANYALMRGFSAMPKMPTFAEATGLNAVAVATYPMYRGVARLVGMDTVPVEGDLKEQVEALHANWAKYDFFFVHIKKVDSYGEDGNFEAKKHKIEEVDKFLPEFLALKPDVLIITGDHSTPARMMGHSWHPVPVMIHSQRVLGGINKAFSERACVGGELGIFPSTGIMPLALANAGRLKKFGA